MAYQPNLLIQYSDFAPYFALPSTFGVAGSEDAKRLASYILIEQETNMKALIGANLYSKLVDNYTTDQYQLLLTGVRHTNWTGGFSYFLGLKKILCTFVFIRIKKYGNLFVSRNGLVSLGTEETKQGKDNSLLDKSMTLYITGLYSEMKNEDFTNLWELMQFGTNRNDGQTANYYYYDFWTSPSVLLELMPPLYGGVIKNRKKLNFNL